MGGADTPNEVLRPRPAVAALESIPRGLLFAVVASMFAGPVVGVAVMGLLVTGTIGPSLAIGGTFALFVVVVVGGSIAAALVRSLTAEYRIYDDHVEVKQGLLSEEFQTVPRSKIHHAAVSGGLVERRFGVGDVELRTRRDDVDVTLQNIPTAETWYERLRPVESGQPVETSPQSLVPSLLRALPFVVLFVAFLAGVAAFVVGPLSPLGGSLVIGSVTVGAVVLAVAFLAGTWINVANTEYRFYDDHIERYQNGIELKRRFVATDDVKNVEFSRGLTERLFDVGTVAIEASWHDSPFHLRSVPDAKGLYDKLRQLG